MSWLESNFQPYLRGLRKGAVYPEPLQGIVEVVEVTLDPGNAAGAAHERVGQEQVELLVESESCERGKIRYLFLKLIGLLLRK